MNIDQTVLNAIGKMMPKTVMKDEERVALMNHMTGVILQSQRGFERGTQQARSYHSDIIDNYVKTLSLDVLTRSYEK